MHNLCIQKRAGWFFALISLVLCGSASHGTPHPNLLFSFEDLPELRAKKDSEPGASIFEALLAEADRYLEISLDPYPFQQAVAGRALSAQVGALAMAGHISGDDRYLKHGAKLLAAAANQSDAALFVSFNDALAVGDSAHALAIGYDWLYPALNEAQRSAVLARIEELGEWLFTHSQTAPWGHDERRRMAHNWNSVTHGSLGLCALILGDRPEWLQRAIERTRAYFYHSKDETGASYEGVGYTAYGMQHVVPFAVALHRRGGPDLLGEVPSLDRVPDYLLWQVLPVGGAVVQLNQTGDSLKPGGTVFHLIQRHHDRVGLWGWNRLLGRTGDNSYGGGSWGGIGISVPYVYLWLDPSLEPLHPVEAGLPLSRKFARGQISMRDGWDDLDSLVTFTSGEGIPGVWNHGDENTFTFYSRGEAFAIDPGPHRGKTSDHNGILVDGHGQDTDGGPTAVQGRILQFEDTGVFVRTTGDATAAYWERAGLERAIRHLVFGRGPQPYLLIADDVQKNANQHEFTWLLQTAPGNEIAIEENRRRAIITGARRGAQLHVFFLHSDGANLSLAASIAGDRNPNPVLRATTRAVNPGFITLLVAVDPGEAPPVVRSHFEYGQLRVEIEKATGGLDRHWIAADGINSERVR